MKQSVARYSTKAVQPTRRSLRGSHASPVPRNTVVPYKRPEKANVPRCPPSWVSRPPVMEVTACFDESPRRRKSRSSRSSCPEPESDPIAQPEPLQSGPRGPNPYAMPHAYARFSRRSTTPDSTLSPLTSVPNSPSTLSCASAPDYPVASSRSVSPDSPLTPLPPSRPPSDPPSVPWTMASPPSSPSPHRPPAALLFASSTPVWRRPEPRMSDLLSPATKGSDDSTAQSVASTFHSANS